MCTADRHTDSPLWALFCTYGSLLRTFGDYDHRAAHTSRIRRCQSALAPTMYPPPWGWVTTSLLSETAPQLPKEALSSDTTLRMYRLTHAQCSCESFYASKIVRSLPLLPTLVSCTGVVPWLMYRQVSAIRKENVLICGTHTYNGGCSLKVATGEVRHLVS